MTAAGDKFVIACNYAEGTSIFLRGALCFLSLPEGGVGNERFQILGRARGGRWVRKYEAARRLDHFRAKRLVPEHPRYSDDRVFPFASLEAAAQYASALESAHLRALVGGVGHRIETERRPLP